jgi:hypothetical protein
MAFDYDLDWDMERERKMLNGLTSKEMVTLTALHALAKIDLLAAKELATKWLGSARSAKARSRRRAAMQTVKNLFS